MERWVLVRKGADYGKICEKYHISPKIAALIRNREVVGDEAINSYLHGTISDLYDGMLMKQMAEAVDILLEKIKEGKKIRIIGDYDIDGIQSTYILLQGLEYLGAKVDSDIPDRMKDGYGLNIHLIERAVDDGIDTIVTCDNGIAASKEIRYAKECGITVVITDHHEVPFDMCGEEKVYLLPPADAVVDPKQPGCMYPFKKLCGAAVAYKLIEAMVLQAGEAIDDLDYLIENVAIATVGDVMDLEGENRILVKEGLEMLRRTRNLGLRALIACNDIKIETLSAYHIGFIIGPCLNASGRLDTAKRALHMLSADSQEAAERLAGDLKALNDTRKEMTNKAVAEAIAQVETTSIANDSVLVVYLPECHESLAGIVAGKVREKFYKPTFVLTKASEGLKGSGRSIDSWHMYDGLNRCKNLLTKFGGHEQAAGLSIPEENLEQFRLEINRTCGITEEDLTEKIKIDMQLPFREATEAFLDELEILEPFGKGNVKPVFGASQVEFYHARVQGKNRNVLRMCAKDEQGTTIEAICFGEVEAFMEKVKEHYGKSALNRLYDNKPTGIKLTITFYPKVNEYQGIKTMQAVVKKVK